MSDGQWVMGNTCPSTFLESFDVCVTERLNYPITELPATICPSRIAHHPSLITHPSSFSMMNAV
ncbi:MAG: hypothetical protein NTW47_10700, partial [Proteobacteria bacterium]|nr:hypothetical protein [Pseudomonadota bacterium]